MPPVFLQNCKEFHDRVKPFLFFFFNTFREVQTGVCIGVLPESCFLDESALLGSFMLTLY